MESIVPVLAIAAIVIALGYFCYRKFEPANDGFNARRSFNAIQRNFPQFEKRAQAVIKERAALCAEIQDMQARLEVMAEELQCNNFE